MRSGHGSNSVGRGGEIVNPPGWGISRVGQNEHERNTCGVISHFTLAFPTMPQGAFLMFAGQASWGNFIGRAGEGSLFLRGRGGAVRIA